MPTLNAELITNVPDLPYLLSIIDDPLKDKEVQKLKEKIDQNVTPYDFGAGTCTLEKITYQSHDGYELTAHYYQPSTLDNPDQRLIMYLHGGGMVYGSVSESDQSAMNLALLTQLPVLSLDYRLAPSNQHPDDLVEDVYAGVKWVLAHSSERQINPQRLILWGQSAGAGLAAGVVTLAAEAEISFYRTALIYPMLDDATINDDAELMDKLTWTPAKNYFGWKSLLQDRLGDSTLPGSVVPAHITNHAVFPPTYIDYGDCDLFVTEIKIFVQQLQEANVATEVHEYPGLVHGFEGYGDATYLPPIYAQRRAWLRG